MVREATLTIGLVGLLACVSGLGCGGGGKVTPLAPSSNNLRTIVLAYGKATQDLGHAPRSKEELLPYFQSAPDPEDPDKPVKIVDVSTIFRSPADEKDYVIHWGVNLADFEGAPSTWPVLAYEREGKDGKRFILQGRYVKAVTDEQLAELPFPPGFKSP